jgi:hypothetical protein
MYPPDKQGSYMQNKFLTFMNCHLFLIWFRKYHTTQDKMKKDEKRKKEKTTREN